MACVFGKAITGNEYTERIDRAREALNMKNAEGKDVKARNYAEILKKEWDEYVEERKPPSAFTDKICFMVLVYNATGETLRYLNSHDYKGHLAHGPYPSRIENGQWGAFLHVQNLNNKDGSNGAVIYKDADQNMGWLLVWHNTGTNKLEDINIYGEVKDVDKYKKEDVWTTVKSDYDKGKSIVCNPVSNNGCAFYGSTGRGLAPMYEAILTFQAAT